MSGHEEAETRAATFEANNAKPQKYRMKNQVVGKNAASLVREKATEMKLQKEIDDKKI